MIDQIVMYIIVRNDLDSMTPGRACAQVSHAANHCIAMCKNFDWTKQWKKETKQHFGTTIVLKAPWDKIMALKKMMDASPVAAHVKFKYDVTHDPEYHVKDGDTIHLIPLDTCMWIFGRKSEIQEWVCCCELL